MDDLAKRTLSILLPPAAADRKEVELAYGERTA
jgi:hypothetical protein